MADVRARLDVDGPIATITNNNSDKHNAFDDATDAAVLEIVAELRAMSRSDDMPEFRAARTEDRPPVYARFISGHALVDGANWQRRSLTNPPVVTVRDQLGKAPFEL